MESDGMYWIRETEQGPQTVWIHRNERGQRITTPVCMFKSGKAVPMSQFVKRKKPGKKKYTLEITETQAQAMAAALEAFTRLGMGQYSYAVDLSVSASKLPGYNPKLEELYREIKNIIHGIDGYYSITSRELPETVHVAHDIYQVIRYKLALDKKPEGGSTVDFSPPLKTSMEDLPKMEQENDS